ncbi:MAG: glycosyltransferase family 2 protein [Sphingobacteriaceae bacterium]|nr:glycosyltransferase family 2 protein [Sphingobacteriaceae bacterium]
MFQPRLSIVTITFNAGAVLQRTMDSVAEQDYPYIDYVLVDGASHDNTVDLIKAQQQQMPLRFVSEPDKGLYDAMNKGLAMAQGDYVLFLNAGDTLADAHVVSEMFATQSEADVYYGHAMVVNLDGKELGLRQPLPPAHLNWKSLQWGMSVCHQAFVIKRSLALPYDLQYRICADIDWMIRCLKQATVTVHTGGLVCRFLADGLSSTHRKKAWKERYQVLSKHYGWFTNLLNHVYIVLRYPFK